MISILTDESYAIDFLSILEVKFKFDITSKKDAENFKFCFDYLSLQLGVKFDNIIQSDEYKNLFLANKKTFEIINDYRKGLVLDYGLADKANLERYKWKQEIQKKFFNSELRETKLVY